MKSITIRLFITALYITILSITLLVKPEEKNKIHEEYITQNVATNFAVAYEDVDSFNIEKDKLEQRKKALVYENMTMEELTTMLNKNLNSTLSNKGNLIASYSLEVGVDPILATAIILQETGCKWDCSYLVKACNNVGGVKGSPGCNGSYMRYSSLDEGIKFFINNLYNNYYKYGLDTAAKMNSKYAESTSWSTYVNNYVKQIKATS